MIIKAQDAQLWQYRCSLLEIPYSWGCFCVCVTEKQGLGTGSATLGSSTSRVAERKPLAITWSLRCLRVIRGTGHSGYLQLFRPRIFATSFAADDFLDKVFWLFWVTRIPVSEDEVRTRECDSERRAASSAFKLTSFPSRYMFHLKRMSCHSTHLKTFQEM